MRESQSKGATVFDLGDMPWNDVSLRRILTYLGPHVCCNFGGIQRTAGGFLGNASLTSSGSFDLGRTRAQTETALYTRRGAPVMSPRDEPPSHNCTQCLTAVFGAGLVQRTGLVLPGHMRSEWSASRRIETKQKQVSQKL